MEQKIKVLVQSVAHATNTMLQQLPQNQTQPQGAVVQSLTKVRYHLNFDELL